MVASKLLPEISPQDVPKTAEELTKFLKRIKQGDVETLPILRKALQHPVIVDLVGGNLAKEAEQSFVNAMAGDDLGLKEGTVRKLEMLRAELSGPNPAPLEKLLVERIVACWLQVQDADLRYAQAKNLSIAWGEYYQRRMDRAHKRYLSALKALAQVRKLALPALQVNIAGQQVNVTG